MLENVVNDCFRSLTTSPPTNDDAMMTVIPIQAKQTVYQGVKVPTVVVSQSVTLCPLSTSNGRNCCNSLDARIK